MYRDNRDLPVAGEYQRYYNDEPRQPQPDPAASLLTSILPLIVTMPGVTQAQTTVDALRVQLAAIPVPAVAVAQPTKQEYDALRDYVLRVTTIVDQSDAAASVGFAAIRKQFLIALLAPLLTGGMGGGLGGNGGIFSILLLMSFLGGGTNLFGI